MYHSLFKLVFHAKSIEYICDLSLNKKIIIYLEVRKVKGEGQEIALFIKLFPGGNCSDKII